MKKHATLMTRVLVTLFLLFASSPGQAETVVRIASLQFGTVNWLLDVIKHHQLDKKYGINVTIVPVASKNAAAVALQGNAADIIVGDWFWVSRQRANGRLFQFAPYSTASGGLIVSPKHNIQSLKDLKGKKIGIAGGKIDKSWLLMQAYSLKTIGEDLNDYVQTIYGAPPLLNALLEQNKIDGVLTFWHYQARLRAQDYHTVIDIKNVLAALDITSNVPINGWIFAQNWGDNNPKARNGFLNAANEATQIMKNSEQEWQRLKTLINEDDKTLAQLKNGYRSGIPHQFTEKEKLDAQKLFQSVAEIGGSELVGKSTTISPGTFLP